MRTIKDWLDDYSVSHQNPTNKSIHWVCVPLIMLSGLGMMWAIPRPAFFAGIRCTGRRRSVRAADEAGSGDGAR